VVTTADKPARITGRIIQLFKRVRPGLIACLAQLRATARQNTGMQFDIQPPQWQQNRGSGQAATISAKYLLACSWLTGPAGYFGSRFTTGPP
jgi:hypothetical protein